MTDTADWHRPSRPGIGIGGRASRERSSVEPSSGRGWKAQSSTRGVSEKRACPEGQQLHDSICSRVPAVTRHHAAAVTRPLGASKGRGASDNTEAALARHRIDEWGFSRVESERRAVRRGGRAVARRASPSEATSRIWRKARWAAASRQHLLTRTSSASPSRRPPRDAG